MKGVAIVIIGESWFSFWPTVAMLEKIKVTVKKIVRRWWLTALVVFLIIAFLLLVAATFMVGLILKFVFGVFALAIIIFLFALSFRDSLKPR